jgi:hypothetical protein
MADNRIQVKLRGIRGNEYSLSSGGNQTRIEADVVAMRDTLRAAFAAPRFRVSDIARWVGATGTLGYAFLLRDTTKGCEWLFGFGGRSDSNISGWLYQMWGNNNAATMGTYFKQPAATTWNNPSTNANAQGLIHFNHNYASSTYAFGFNDTTALTYTGGDFSTPGTSPYTALATFMPSTTGRYHGIDLGNWSVGDAWNRRSMTYDLPRGVLAFDLTYGQNLAYSATVMSGKEMFPTNANGGLASGADTRRDALVFLPRVPSGGSWAGLESVQNLLTLFVRADGTTVETLGRPTNVLNDFNRANYLSGGQVQVRKLQIAVSGYIKGFLDWELLNESFPHNDGGFNLMPLALPDVDNPMIHDHPQFTRFYKKDAAPYIAIPEAGLPIV